MDGCSLLQNLHVYRFRFLFYYYIYIYYYILKPALEKKNRVREKKEVWDKVLHSRVELQDMCIFNLLQTIKDYDLQWDFLFAAELQIDFNSSTVLTAWCLTHEVSDLQYGSDLSSIGENDPSSPSSPSVKVTDSICRLNKQTQKRSPDVETHTDPNTLSQELVFNKLPVGVGWEGISSFWINSDNLQMSGDTCVGVCVREFVCSQETVFSSTCFTLADLIKEEGW